MSINDELDHLSTEMSNLETGSLNELTTKGILEKINDEDVKVPLAVKKQIPNIAKAVDIIVLAFQNRGRLFYLGAGTSGRLAVIDAAELFPTFGVGKESVRAIIAGGKKAMFRTVEGAEDDPQQGRKDLERASFSKSDVLIGISASGRTPFVVGALRYAHGLGAKTVALTSNPGSPVTKVAQVAICPETGPEVVTGSTRMKAGTAQKLVLNMISTATMVKLGKVHQNLMVSLKPFSQKLGERQKRIVMQATGLSRDASEKILVKAKGSVKIAIVMVKSDLDYHRAEKLLKNANDSIDVAVSIARKETTS